MPTLEPNLCIIAPTNIPAMCVKYVHVAVKPSRDSGNRELRYPTTASLGSLIQQSRFLTFNLNGCVVPLPPVVLVFGYFNSVYMPHAQDAQPRN